MHSWPFPPSSPIFKPRTQPRSILIYWPQPMTSYRDAAPDVVYLMPQHPIARSREKRVARDKRRTLTPAHRPMRSRLARRNILPQPSHSRPHSPNGQSSQTRQRRSPASPRSASSSRSSRTSIAPHSRTRAPHWSAVAGSPLAPCTRRRILARTSP